MQSISSSGEDYNQPWRFGKKFDKLKYTCIIKLTMNIYLELTQRFNAGQLRAVLSGGQAVVLHRLAIMSKDADWILREDEDTMRHVLSVLKEYGAHYRFGAPLDIRWLSGGWSAHLEFSWKGLRVRTDFVTRPPRLDSDALQRLWREQWGRDIAFVNARDLAELKKTNREKDYVVIGEIARRMENLDDQLLYSRSARDLIRLAQEHPDRVKALSQKRPVLLAVPKGLEELESALDAERRKLIHANEERLAKYMSASEAWAGIWPDIAKEIEGLTLSEAHKVLVKRAHEVLPFHVPGGWP